MIKKKILFIADTSLWSNLAGKFIKENFSKAEVYLWDHGTSGKPQIENWSGDWIVCFKADLIIPKSVLLRARGGVINFHPSVPKYRGIGGYHYALKNGDSDFGATCHYMVEKVDNGKIIAVRRFPILPNETFYGLKERTGAYCLTLFYEIMILILKGLPLSTSKAKWSKRLYTYKDLEAEGIVM